MASLALCLRFSTNNQLFTPAMSSHAHLSSHAKLSKPTSLQCNCSQTAHMKSITKLFNWKGLNILQTVISQMINTSTHTTYYEVIFTHQWSSLEMKRCPTVFLLSKLSVIFSDLPVYEGIHFQLKAWLGCVNEITRWPSWQHPQRLLLCRTAATCHLSEMSNTIAQACISSEIKSDSSIKHFYFLFFCICNLAQKQLLICCTRWRSPLPMLRKVTFSKTQFLSLRIAKKNFFSS